MVDNARKTTVEIKFKGSRKAEYHDRKLGQTWIVVYDQDFGSEVVCEIINIFILEIK